MAESLFKSEFDYFILIANEMNISKAAEKAFITQQAMSKYLTALEKRCGTPLFYRKPVFALTPAGHVLLRRAKQISQLTENLEDELLDIIDGRKGRLRFGIGSGRSFNVIPPVLKAFWKTYPNIDVQIHSNITANLSKMVLSGKLDMILGIVPEPDPELKITPIASESIYLAITDQMLEAYFPDEYPECKSRFFQGVDLKEFAHVPFTICRKTAGINKFIFQHLSKNNIHLKYALTTTSNELNMLMCDSVGCFCLGFLAPYVAAFNQAMDGSNHINLFPIEELKDCCPICLVERSNGDVPLYFKYFSQLLIQFITNGYSAPSKIWPFLGHFSI